MNPNLKRIAAGIGITGFVVAGATAISYVNQPAAAPKTIQLVPATPAADTADTSPASAADPPTTTTTVAAPATTASSSAKMVPVTKPDPTTTTTPVSIAPTTTTTEAPVAAPTTTTTTAPPPCPDPAANVNVSMIIGGDPKTGDTLYEAQVDNDSLNPIEVDLVEFTVNYPDGSGVQNLILDGGQGTQIDAGGTETFQVGDPVPRITIRPKNQAISQFHYHAICG